MEFCSEHFFLTCVYQSKYGLPRIMCMIHDSPHWWMHKFHHTTETCITAANLLQFLSHCGVLNLWKKKLRHSNHSLLNDIRLSWVTCGQARSTWGCSTKEMLFSFDINVRVYTQCKLWAAWAIFGIWHQSRMTSYCTLSSTLTGTQCIQRPECIQCSVLLVADDSLLLWHP